MTGKEISTMQKIGKGIVLVVGAPFIMIGMMLAIYIAMFSGIVKLIRNRGKVRQAAPQPVMEEIVEPAMEPILEPAMMARMAR